MKIVNIETDIIYNFKNFFIYKNIKYYRLQIIFFNIKNLDVKSIQFFAYINKTSL